MSAQFMTPEWPAPDNVFAVSTTRCGGCSATPYMGLNLGEHVADDPAAVTANREILQRALPAETAIQWLTQVHGNRVVAAGPTTAEGDATWTRQVGRGCAVLTADCLPLLLCSTAGDVVAAVHAGWRGMQAGVIEASVAAMKAEPQKILAWLGPAIGPDAFEVGPEVRTGFLLASALEGRSSVAACFEPSTSKPGYFYADIYALARHRLRATGVGAIYGGGLCTYSDRERFFSYRRDGQTGRMATVIVLG
ncbi:MAG: peptidoglycan editing factor PgeF [Halieaceae bacterium]|jgi:polyphenol oxidase|nr:peptidoglycan editing factor PgeF [Halieaceae bacterium]